MRPYAPVYAHIRSPVSRFGTPGSQKKSLHFISEIRKPPGVYMKYPSGDFMGGMGFTKPLEPQEGFQIP